MIIKLILPMPISINKAYAGYPKRHKSNEYKKWIIEANRIDNEPFIIEGDEWLEVDYTYYTPLYFKNGNKKVIDVFNYEKVLSDYLCDNIKGFEDHKIKKGTVQKIDSSKNLVEIQIKEVK